MPVGLCDARSICRGPEHHTTTSIPRQRRGTTGARAPNPARSYKKSKQQARRRRLQLRQAAVTTPLDVTTPPPASAPSRPVVGPVVATPQTASPDGASAPKSLTAALDEFTDIDLDDGLDRDAPDYDVVTFADIDEPWLVEEKEELALARDACVVC